ncbi:MAG TPA: dockerin type I domain-containing protein [Dehalococcoidia bacterium]|nr:dockerin type I domain-containing protein [Dehalococcoidia bacterium]
MARYLCPPLLVLILLLLSGGSPAVAPAAAAAGTAQGDVTCDGAVNAVDSLQILRSVAGLSTSAECLPEAADVNCDSAVNAVDALRILRYVAGLSNEVPDGCAPIGEPLAGPATSEELIAAALDGHGITYEESLLYRAYALFDDPRLPDQFRSPIMDWEAGSDLFHEIDESEGTLSAQVLSDLAPFRARPNDPISIFSNAPQANTLSEQAAPAFGWQSEEVPGTYARVWALGAPGVQHRFVQPVSDVWSAMLGLFVYPNPDQPGDPNTTVNPDSDIDLYFVNPGIDPRSSFCMANPGDQNCLQSDDDGMARRSAQFVGNKSSGHLLVNLSNSGDNLLDTIAHELTHVSQYSYDTGEASWLYESTATWTAFRVMQTLGKEPAYEHHRVPELFQNLAKPLNRETRGDNDKYASWLFFLHASMERGDGIVSSVWDKAKSPGAQGINAVDQAFSLDDNFAPFTVKNWNEKPPLIKAYKDAPDTTFPDDQPKIDRDITVPGEHDYTLDLPVETVSARYYRYVFESPVRHIIFENNLVNTPHAHVWLLKKISGDWKPPEDMAGAAVETWCRDSQTFDEDLQELIVIVSNSEIGGPALNHNSPRVIADEIGCYEVEGWAETTLHVVNDGEDITYNSGHVNLKFVPRAVQDEPGDVRYDLAAGSGPVNWVVSGTTGDCTVSGGMNVAFSGIPFDPASTDPAGYLNVVAPGDFHSVIVRAYNVGATTTITCPGDPPSVSQGAFDAIYLLLITSQANSDQGKTLEGDQFLVAGDQTYHFRWHFVRHDELAPLFR